MRAFSGSRPATAWTPAKACGEQMTGRAIAIAFARTPMTLANVAWDLQTVTGGRFVLGLGSQIRPHIEQRFSMPWGNPVARMDELVANLAHGQQRHRLVGRAEAAQRVERGERAEQLGLGEAVAVDALRVVGRDAGRLLAVVPGLRGRGVGVGLQRQRLGSRETVKVNVRVLAATHCNLEQAIAPDVGYFLRMMKTDGRTETHAFTEADDSLSTGLLIRGSRWGRSGDTIGLSFMRSGLSRDRRNYLAAGGVSFFIGDGALEYKPERIVEAFYSLALHERLWLTADVQRIHNPAYNAARGPVSIVALRVHAQF